MSNDAEYRKHRDLCNLYRDLNNGSRQATSEVEQTTAQVTEPIRLDRADRPPVGPAEQSLAGTNSNQGTAPLPSPETKRPEEVCVALCDEENIAPDQVPPEDTNSAELAMEEQKYDDDQYQRALHRAIQDSLGGDFTPQWSSNSGASSFSTSSSSWENRASSSGS